MKTRFYALVVITSLLIAAMLDNYVQQQSIIDGLRAKPHPSDRTRDRIIV